MFHLEVWRRSVSSIKRRVLFVGFLALCVLAFTAWQFRKGIRLPVADAWIDIVLGTCLLAIVPFAMAAYGGHVAAESIEDPEQRKRVKRRFWQICFFGVVLAFIQQYRSINQDVASKSKTNQVEGAILGQLHNLHEQGHALTPEQAEAKRREDIQSLLRDQYILSHDPVDPLILAGNAPPPQEWVNRRLSEMGEKWTVSDGSREHLSDTSPRTYITYDGTPRFVGSTTPNVEGGDFKPGDPLAFNVHYKVTGPHSVEFTGMGNLLAIEPNAELKTQQQLISDYTEEMKQEIKRTPSISARGSEVCDCHHPDLRQGI
jgi:hypothetical protein